MSEVKTKKGSKVVFIRRAPLSLAEATGGPDSKEYFDNSYRAIGSYWPNGSMRPGTGLTLTEEKILMPEVLNMDPTDRDFREKSTDYFHNIATKVDPTDSKGNGGTRLEIGLEDPELEVCELNKLGMPNLPLNVTDYIKWRHALAHPNIATSAEDAKGNKLVHYFIYDPAEVRSFNNTVADMKDDALAAYLSIKGSITKVVQYLTLLKEDPASYRGQESVKLRELAMIEPAKFLKVHKDPEKDAKQMLLDLIGAAVLEQQGTMFIVSESRKQLAGTLKEAIAYIRNPANSAQIVIFKSLIQDWKRSKKIATEDPQPSDTPVTEKA